MVKIEISKYLINDFHSKKFILLRKGKQKTEEKFEYILPMKLIEPKFL